MLLGNCSNLRLKTYVMLLAATGLRATEALSDKRPVALIGSETWRKCLHVIAIPCLAAFCSIPNLLAKTFNNIFHK